MSRILIVEDSEATRMSLDDLLRAEHQLTLAATVADGLAAACRDDFDLMLVDLTLPDGDGFEFCRRLATLIGRELPPFIFISGRYDIQDKLTGFALGAEDYVVKPFDPTELKARVGIRLRRRAAVDPVIVTARAEGLDLDDRGLKVTVRVDGAVQDLGLTPSEFKLLRALLSTPDAAVSRASLLEAGWGGDVHVLERTVDRHISGLRRKLGALGTRLAAVPGAGYIWHRRPQGRA